MNTCWAALWFLALDGAFTPASTVRAGAAIGGMYLLASLVGRWAAFRQFGDLQKGCLGAALVLANLAIVAKILLGPPQASTASRLLGQSAFGGWGEAFQAIHAELLGAALALFVAWRGAWLGQQRVGPHLARREFALGAGLLLGYAASFDRSAWQGQALWPFLAFLFSALIAQGTARAGFAGFWRLGRRAPFDRSWLAGVAGAAGIALGAAALPAWLLAGQVERLSRAAGAALDFAGMLVTSPVILLGAFLSSALQRLPARAVPATPEPGSALPPLDGLPELPIPGGLASIGKALSGETPFLAAILGWALAALAIALLAVRWRRLFAGATKREGEDDGADFSGAPEELGAWIRRGFRWAPWEGEAGPVRRLSLAERLWAAARIRRIYARLLALAAEFGYARPPSRTPHEFLVALKRVFPGMEEDLVTITEAYVRVRYGTRPETPRQVQQVERAWLRLRAFAEPFRQEVQLKRAAVQPAASR